MPLLKVAVVSGLKDGAGKWTEAVQRSGLCLGVVKEIHVTQRELTPKNIRLDDVVVFAASAVANAPRLTFEPNRMVIQLSDVILRLTDPPQPPQIQLTVEISVDAKEAQAALEQFQDEVALATTYADTEKAAMKYGEFLTRRALKRKHS